MTFALANFKLSVWRPVEIRLDVAAIWSDTRCGTGLQRPNIKDVSAERVPFEANEAEMIYLVVPPSRADRAKPQSIHEMGAALQAVGIALAWLVLACIGLYGLYWLKSLAGIDLFPDQHLEDFVPVPGYQRW